MCGCGGGGFTYGATSSGYCSYKFDKLTEARNLLAIMYNKTADPVKKDEYKALLVEVNVLQDGIRSGAVCPETSVVNSLINTIEIEYAEYNNN